MLSTQSRINDPKLDIPEIDVIFANGLKQRMVLHHYNTIPNSETMEHSKLCNYIGHLEGDETDSKVSVTGCLMGNDPDEKMHITLLSKHSPFQKSFSLDRHGTVRHVNIKDDKRYQENAKPILSDRDVHVDDWKNLGNEVFWTKVENKSDSVSEELLAAVPYTIAVNFRLGYDKGTKDYLEKVNVNIDNWLAEVMTHAQVHFLHSSLQHQIFFMVTL